MKLLLGILGFTLLFMNDVNDVKFNKRWMKTLFPIGCFGVFASSVMAVGEDIKSGALFQVSCVLFMIIASVCFGLLIYTLFFALPFSESYVENLSERKVCDVGMYAVCRHPGVIWFFLFYLFSGMALQKGALLVTGMILSGWNLLYVIFQDYYTFPKMFSDYREYKKTTPFIIPSRESLRRGIHTWPKKRSKRGDRV